MSVKSDVDELLEWYVQHRPDVSHVAVNCRPNTLRRFAKKKRSGPYTYKGFELTPIKQKKQPRVTLSVEMPK